MEEDKNVNTESATEPVPNAVPKKEAPKMRVLLSNGWLFVKAQPELMSWYILSLVAISVFSSEYFLMAGDIMLLVSFIGIFVSTIFVLMNSWAVIYASMKSKPHTVSYKESFGWSSGNFFPILGTTILSGLAVVLGIVLFIIPGIALSIYLYFVLYAVVSGSGFGMKALKQSYLDVKGRWWKVAFKLFTLSFWVVLLYLLPLAIIGASYAYFIDKPLAVLVVDVLFQGVFSGVVGAMAVFAVAQYYKFLRRNPFTKQDV